MCMSRRPGLGGFRLQNHFVGPFLILVKHYPERLSGIGKAEAVCLLPPVAFFGDFLLQGLKKLALHDVIPAALQMLFQQIQAFL